MPLLVGLGLVALFVTSLMLNASGTISVTDLLDRGIQFGKHVGPWGAAMFVAIQVGIAASGILPASLLGMAAGAIYGIEAGFMLSASGTLLGAWVAFSLTRSLFRRWIVRFATSRARFRNLDLRLGRESWRFVALLRLSPIMPFAITSYALGLSSISARAYMLGSIAALPALFGYVLLGTLAHAGLQATQDGAGLFRWVLIFFGFASTVFLTARIGHIVRLALRDADDATVEVSAISLDG